MAALVLVAVLAGCGDDDTVRDAAETELDDTDLSEATEDVGRAAADLADTLDELGLTSLASAIDEVPLDQLVDVGPYTFLAPSDEAFTALSADEIADLLADPALLLETLENHVVDGRMDAAALSGADGVETRRGSILTVEAGDRISIGGATVTTADVPVGEDGIVHVVDALLIPAA